MLLLTARVGAFAMGSISSVTKSTVRLYEHPFAVTQGWFDYVADWLRDHTGREDKAVAGFQRLAKAA
jgi:hypothetical protein